MKRIIDYSLLITTVGIMGTACENKPPKTTRTLKDSTTENPAIASLKDQLSQFPDSTRLYDKLIDQYTTAKNYEAAIAWCDSLLKRNEDINFSYWFVKGDLQRQALQFDSAIKSYTIYLQRFPDDEQVLLNLANTAAEAGKIESLALSDDIMRRSPDKEIQASGYFIKGVYYSRTKEFDKAIENFDQTIVNRYSFWEAYLEKAIAQYDQHQFDKSLATLAQLLQVNPTYPDAFYWQGKVYEALNKKQEAFKNYEAAYGLDKSFIEAKEKADSLR
ncbi:MAG: tetratricopeptide repeat protein [Bacteroidota bacterium]